MEMVDARVDKDGVIVLHRAQLSIVWVTMSEEEVYTITVHLA